MDPRATGGSLEDSGLPRDRGDGPLLRSVDPVYAAAPPRPRGWTLSKLRTEAADRGSPATAGMDPWGRFRLVVSGDVRNSPLDDMKKGAPFDIEG